MEETSLVQTQPGDQTGFSSWSADPRCPFKHPVLFFNWSLGCNPPTPQRPICSLGSQSHQPVPELWASWASCLQVCAETSGGGGGQVLSVSLDAVIGGGWWSGSRSQVSAHSRKLIPKPRDRRLQRQSGENFDFWWGRLLKGSSKGSYRARSVDNQSGVSLPDR